MDYDRDGTFWRVYGRLNEYPIGMRLRVVIMLSSMYDRGSTGLGRAVTRSGCFSYVYYYLVYYYTLHATLYEQSK